MTAFEALRRFFFGDDVFISYSRRDGADYALALAGDLTKRGVVCFLDQWGTEPGKELPAELTRRLRRSSMLVIVGTEAAAASERVAEEVAIFRDTKRPIIPIFFGSPADSTWYPLIEGVAVTAETTEALAAHQPSARVLDRIVNAEGFKRRNTRLRNVFWTTLVGTLLVLAAGAATARHLQSIALEARRQQATAERQQRRALSERLASEAEKNLETMPQKSLALATLAMKLYVDSHDPRIPAAEQAMRRALSVNGGLALDSAMNSYARPVISPDQHWLATALRGDVLLWDLTRGFPAKPFHRFVEAAGNHLSFSSNSQWLISDDHLLRLPTPIRRAAVYPLEMETVFAGFSPDSRWAVTVETCAKLWDLHAEDPGSASVALGEDFRALDAELDKVPESDPRRERLERVVLDSFLERAVVSSDWRRILAFSYETIRDPVLFDLAAPDPKKSGVVLRGCASKSSPLFDSSPDGRWVAVVEYDGTYDDDEDDQRNVHFRTCLWDLKNVGPSRPTSIRGHTGAVGVAFSPDSRWLVTAGTEPTVRLWDLKTPDPTAHPRVFDKYSGPISAIQFSADGQWLATAARYTDRSKGNHALQLLDLTEPGRSIALDELQGDLNLLAFSPDNQWLVAAEDDAQRGLHVWHLPQTVAGMERSADPTEHVLLRGHDGPVTGVAFMAKGKQLITVGADERLRLWQLEGRRNWSAAPQVLRAGSSAIVVASPTRDDRWLVAANRYYGGTLWNLGQQTATPFGGGSGTSHLMRLSPDNRWFVRGDGGQNQRKDPDLHLYRLKEGAAAHPIRLALGSTINAVEFTSDGRRLITGSDRGVSIWDLPQDDAVDALTPTPLPGHAGRVRSMAVSPDDRWLVIVDESSSVAHLRRLDSPASPAIPLRGHASKVTSAAFSPDRRWLATAEERGVVRLWNLADLPNSRMLISGQRVEFLTFSSDAHWLIATDGSTDFSSTAYGSYSSTLWDLTTPGDPQRRVMTRSSGGGLDNALFSPDGRWLLTNCNERCAAEDTGPPDILKQTVMLWDLNALAAARAAPVVLVVRGLQAAFSPDGRWLLLGTTLWDLTAPDIAASAIDLPVFSRERENIPFIHAVAFTHNSRRAIVCTDDVLLYDLDAGELLKTAERVAARNLTRTEFREVVPAERYRKVFPRLP